MGDVVRSGQDRQADKTQVVMRLQTLARPPRVRVRVRGRGWDGVSLSP